MRSAVRQHVSGTSRAPSGAKRESSPVRSGYSGWDSGWVSTPHGGETSVFRFSIHHSITSAQAFTTAFVLMAFAQVLSRGDSNIDAFGSREGLPTRG